MQTELPGIGAIAGDDAEGYRTPSLHVEIFGAACEFTVDWIEPGQETALSRTILDFCAIDRSVLAAATPALYAYYLDMAAHLADQDWFPQVAEDEVWANVHFNLRPFVHFQDGRWYVISEDECTWEPEHGLQFVFAEGRTINRISPYDGHPTNRSAWGSAYVIPEDAVYWAPR